MITNYPGETASNSTKVHNKTARKSAQDNPKSAQEVHRTKKQYPKTAAAYWLPKVKKPQDSTLFGVQIAYRGKRHRFPLETANKDTAAEKARDIYLSLVGVGWDATVERFKPKTVKRKQSATVGALISVASRLSSARPTSLEAYSQALRRITAGALGIEDKFKRQAAKNGNWKAAVDNTPLEKLTPSLILEWKNRYLKAAKTPQARNSAVVSFNALMRNSKALLSKKLRPFIEGELVLPVPLWFDGVAREKEPSLRYLSKIDAGEILAAAQDELAQDQPEVYKALLLTLVCGLRRSEADALLWRQFDFNASVLEIADTEHKALKSKDSAGQLGLDKELVALFRGYKTRASGEFVLEEPTRRGKRHKVYRCNMHFMALIVWLKKKGVSGIRPIHTLRKEIGSIIATREGIFNASRYLRHSNISITAKLYADVKKPVTAGLGSFLAAPLKNVIEANFTNANALQKEASA
ncbi:tyrosine-type recombinase/integrase [Brevifollis gellanilyticus]|uniref:Tyr recombinase domain-containing protein n=1 Tax=Brevifollis gellanilyticus TaxID=748831 RepID=A0A512MFW8_9BACT|nr:tyrosine-type recombinase/integrase [Brevifollis gellanilyticus]GEP45640.1 hypothetical protein BGE01nite_49310 [Brevifollis gellanilyticus]